MGLTAQQQSAVSLTGSSAVVSAAAGSGKTRVLAERCVYLTCDAPSEHRCHMDELLVLTFTEAAAVEMRQRIRAALQQRLGQQPTSRALQRELQLLEHSHLSTIHAFCFWLIKRHFTSLDIDPQATILDEDESLLLLHESTREVFQRWQDGSNEKSQVLRKLLRDHGGGREEVITQDLIRLHQYLRSVEDMSEWLSSARHNHAMQGEDIVACERAALIDELARQRRALTTHIDQLRLIPDMKQAYVESAESYANFLAQQLTRLERGQDLESCLTAIRSHAIAPVRSGIKTDLASAQELTAKEIGQQLVSVSRKWLKRRLQERFASFSLSEWLDGLARTSDDLHAIEGLILAINDRYAKRKLEQEALDFSDLEHFALTLLVDDQGQPSDVARAVQRRFQHVLVDEFQDINPLQSRILELVSRETDTAVRDNLFVVGDIKQSIYRFRLAEPTLFRSRIERALQPQNSDRLIVLSKNFRSRVQIIEGVNHVFRTLMSSELTGITYDDTAALQLGRSDSQAGPAIELDLLIDDDDQARQPFAELNRFDKQVQRIGQRIQETVQTGEYDYGDIVILLRAASHRADRMAGILQQMDIPVHAQANSGFFGSTEVSDVLALLQVLDNAQQDIPLATIMRNGVLGVRFSETELLAIRHTDPQLPFCHCVQRATSGELEEGLRAKVGDLLAHIARYRQYIHRLALGDALWRIYTESGYLSYVTARSMGSQRRANLVMLHRRAQQFAEFGGHHGLSEFVEFVQQLISRGKDLGPASVSSSENTVRIMTIHNSKGLEFPVVFLANLDKGFNLQDEQHKIIFDRHQRLGISVVDAQKRIRYTSLTQRYIKEQLRRDNLAEELRVLYVGMTRAMDRLVLCGACAQDTLTLARRSWHQHQGTIPDLVLLEGRSYLDWLLPAICCHPSVCWPGEESADPLFVVQTHCVAAEPRHHDATEKSDVHVACASLSQLPSDVASATHKAAAVMARVKFRYPHHALTQLPAVLNVSDLRHRRPTAGRDDAWDQAAPVRESDLRKPRFLIQGGPYSPSEQGIATHLYLQHFDYAQPAALREQLHAMVSDGRISLEQSQHIDLDHIAWFVGTELGQRVCAAFPNIHREWAFIHKVLSSEFVTEPTDHPTQDFVLIRGMVDLLVPTLAGWEVIDFKTDRVAGQSLWDRAGSYKMPMTHYANAVEQITQARVYRTSLVFLHGQQIIDLADC